MSQEQIKVEYLEDLNTIKLVTCNNCGNVYDDPNPGKESMNYLAELIPLFKIKELPTIEMKDGDIGYACPDCKTDEYLQDNINVNCGGKAENLHVYLYE